MCYLAIYDVGRSSFASRCILHSHTLRRFRSVLPARSAWPDVGPATTCRSLSLRWSTSPRHDKLSESVRRRGRPQVARFSSWSTTSLATRTGHSYSVTVLYTVDTGCFIGRWLSYIQSFIKTFSKLLLLSKSVVNLRNTKDLTTSRILNLSLAW